MAGILLPIPQAVQAFQFMTFCLITQSLLIKSAETVNCSEPTTDSLLSALKESIFYKTEIRPVFNLNTPTNISLSFILYGILDVDEKAQKLNTFLWVDMSWYVEGLSWDPVECGTDRISLPREDLWMPDVVINQFIDENKVPDTFYLYVYGNGLIYDSMPFHVISSCNLDIYTFPFDIQNCTFTFNSYQHTVLDLQLFFAESVEVTFKKSLSVMTTKGEWELVDMRAKKPSVPPEEVNGAIDALIYYNTKEEILKNVGIQTGMVPIHFYCMDTKPMGTIAVRLRKKRRASLYIVNLLIPSCFLIAVDLFSFLLPPQNTDRSAFKMTLILGYTVFLLLMNDLLPVTGNTLPLINAFFSLCLALMVASLLETIFITNILCGSSRYQPLPQWVKVLFLHYVARLVCLSKSDQNGDLEENKNETSCFNPVKIPKTEAVHTTPPSLQKLKTISQELLSIRQQVDEHFNSNQTEDEWVHLGQVIDRLLFILYVIFIVVSFITITVYWLYWYNVNVALI